MRALNHPPLSLKYLWPFAESKSFMKWLSAISEWFWIGVGGAEVITQNSKFDRGSLPHSVSPCFLIPSGYLTFCTMASWTIFPILHGKCHCPLPTQFSVLLTGCGVLNDIHCSELQCRDTPGWSELGQDWHSPICQCLQHHVFIVASVSAFIPYTSHSFCVILDGWRGPVVEELRI